MLSYAAVVNRFFRRFTGQTIPSALNCSQTPFAVTFSISRTLSYEIESPRLYRSLTKFD